MDHSVRDGLMFLPEFSFTLRRFDGCGPPHRVDSLAALRSSSCMSRKYVKVIFSDELKTKVGLSPNAPQGSSLQYAAVTTGSMDGAFSLSKAAFSHLKRERESEK